MRKTDKKVDNALREALTQVCDVAQDQHAGFEWLTHFVNYGSFPDSLRIVCVFDGNAHLAKADTNAILMSIKAKLAALDIKLKDINRHVVFDTEEQCLAENNGKWNERLNNALALRGLP